MKMGVKHKEMSVDEGFGMMLDLNMTVYKYRGWSRWMRKFNFKCPSEKRIRNLSKQCSLAEVVVEMIPFSFVKDKHIVMRQAPMAYVSGLKDMVFHRLEYLESAGLLLHHDFLGGEIHVKIGGDHGQKSYKEAFQICNVASPNSKDNTIVFCLFEAKDRKTNLKIALSQYKEEIDVLQASTWRGRKIRVFMFGDYDNLTEMYGLSGASGRHYCLWCGTTKEKAKSGDYCASRTLKSLDENYNSWVENGSNKNDAKCFENVIDRPYYDIDLNQVVVPGLHITLGIVLKIFDLFERDIRRLDYRITHSGGDDMIDHVINQEKYIESLKEGIVSVTNQFNWMMIDSSEEEGEEIQRTYDLHTKAVQDQIDKKDEELKLYKKAHGLQESGPIHHLLLDFLNKIGVQRQAFHSNSFTGNHCHILLKEKNLQKMMLIALNYINEELIDDIHLVNPAILIKQQFEPLFLSYSCCHNLMNSSGVVDVDLLDSAVSTFMGLWRKNWPDETIPPKYHFLEKHVVEFIRRWKAGLGFYGEQGGESIHHEFVNLYEAFANMVRDPLGRLKSTMTRHHMKTHPKFVALRPEIKTRRRMSSAN